MDDLTLDSICGIRLYQSRKGYRFSIDSVLLSGFIRLARGVRRVVDLGAGSGVVGLILARRCPGIKELIMIEVQEDLFTLARRNIELNQLQERVTVVRADISLIHTSLYPELMTEKFDVVVTNPPFRRPHTGRISPYDERAIARHEIRLTLKDLFKTADILLKNRGRLFMIYHPYRLSELIHNMKTFSFEPKRMRFVHPDTGSEATMVLIEARSEEHTSELQSH